MYLKELIIDIAKLFIKNHSELNYMLPGHNGPYHDPETPVRNTGHCLILFSYCYSRTVDDKYKRKVDIWLIIFCQTKRDHMVIPSIIVKLNKKISAMD